MRLHPATQILIWSVLVAAMQLLPDKRMLIAGCMVLLVVFVLYRHKFIQLVRRTRWIMFSLWLIYAYSTPGQPLIDGLGVFSPGVEGLMDGGMQLMRLLVALAGLAILLSRLHRQQFIAGLYALFAPLQWMGLSRERLAVRLALTLHYAEVVMLRTQTWQENLRSLFEPHADAGHEIELPVCRFARADFLLLTGSVLLLWLATR